MMNDRDRIAIQRGLATINSMPKVELETADDKQNLGVYVKLISEIEAGRWTATEQKREGATFVDADFDAPEVATFVFDDDGTTDNAVYILGSGTPSADDVVQAFYTIDSLGAYIWEAQIGGGSSSNTVSGLFVSTGVFKILEANPLPPPAPTPIYVNKVLDHFTGFDVDDTIYAYNIVGDIYKALETLAY